MQSQQSYLDHPGDWQNRKISLLGAAKSFLSQLSIGQDLTKVSLPAAFQYPYSALELGAFRSLAHCTTLYSADNDTDPLQRFLNCLRWLLSATQREQFEKKPYNPILGEFHMGWVDSKEYGTTTYLAEQVVHHPPVLAYVMENETAEMTVQGNISFGIKFHGNSVSVAGMGPNKMVLKKHNEHYDFSSVLPNLSIKNVILGTKRIYWDGEITVHCPETGYRAKMVFKEEGWSAVNTVHGTLWKNDKEDDPLITFQGPCGGLIEMKNCSTNKKEVLLDSEKVEKCNIRYPPSDAVDDRFSLKLWSDVSKAIYEDDMPKADVAKRVIEEGQRKRRAESANFEPRFFEENSTTKFWECRVDKLRDLCKTCQRGNEEYNPEANDGKEKEVSSPSKSRKKESKKKKKKTKKGPASP